MPLGGGDLHTLGGGDLHTLGGGDLRTHIPSSRAPVGAKKTFRSKFGFDICGTLVGTFVMVLVLRLGLMTRNF